MTNKKRTLFGYLFTIALALHSISTSAAPPSLASAKQRIIAYQESGEYRKEITDILQEAKHYLQHRAKENRRLSPPKKLAIILDIDETALSNINFIRENNFCFNKEQMQTHFSAADDAAIIPVLNLYRHAKQLDVAVFFITARREQFRAATEKNLDDAGYYHWDGVLMRPNYMHKKTIREFKEEARQNIINEGYTIIMAIGDKEQDLSHKNAEKNYLLPNPFY